MLAAVMKMIIPLIGSIIIAFTLILLRIVHVLKEVAVTCDLTVMRFFWPYRHQSFLGEVCSNLSQKKWSPYF